MDTPKFIVQHYTWSKCEQFYLLHIVYKIILLAVMSEYASETVVVLAGLLRPFICTLYHSCRLVYGCRAEANIIIMHRATIFELSKITSH